jgi:RNA polymerase sigma factor (sigma-70 family)
MTQLLHKTEATEATATLYESHHRRIRGYCLGQLRDSEEANDAMQSTFLYAFAALQRGVAPRNELPWLFTIAHNVCRTRRRSLLRRSRLEAAIDIDSLCDSVGRDDPSHEDLDALGSSLAALPENQRRALLLREWQGLSYSEVAARMGLTESAVEAVIFRARRSLAAKLRAANRVASLVGAVCFLPGLRRLGSVAGTAKAAAATLAVGLVAGTAIEPLVHSHGQASPTSRHAGGIQQAVRRVSAGTAAAETVRAGHTMHRAKAPVAAPRYAARTGATPASSSAQPPAGSSPQAPAAGSDASQPPRAEATAVADRQPDATTEPQAPSRPAAHDPVRNVVADVPAGRPKSDVEQLLPPLQDVLSSVPVPTPAADGGQAPSLPAPVQSALDDVQNVAPPSPALPSAPEVPSASAAPAPAPSALPSLPPLPNPPVPPSSLPDSPTQGTPLQASP